MKVAAGQIAELQGLYGAFSFHEKLLQKIWLRGDFDRSAVFATDGRFVRVIHPGRWNLLGGPDFRNARLAIGRDREITGDVEVHLQAGDWDAHGHALDPAYDGVVLHVVLFPPETHRTTRNRDGGEIPIVALLPLLHHDLEEFAADEAVEVLANRSTAGLVDELAVLPPDELVMSLRRSAEARWRQKIHFARLRVQRLGWDDACHCAALEILGYRFNRAVMLRIAGRWPLTAWINGLVNADEVYASEGEGWSLQGVRPANHPRARLRQYASWVQARPDWPTRLVAQMASLPDCDVRRPTRITRRANSFAELRQHLAGEISGLAIRGSRLDTMLCDGLLPLGATRVPEDVHGLWFHWFAGDLPEFVLTGLRLLGVFDGRSQPACHGLAQGLLGWLLEREARR